MKINSKSISRIATVQLIYQLTIKLQDTSYEKVKASLLEFYRDPNLKKEYDVDEDFDVKLHLNFFQGISDYAYNNLNEVNEILKRHLLLKIDEPGALARSILHVAITELKYYPEVAAKIIINEYTTIASEMLGPKEVNFINSLLDKIAKEMRSHD